MANYEGIDPNTFRAFEHEGWQDVATRYHDIFGKLTCQAIQPLLDAAEVGAGSRVLDVASGPGFVAASAAARGARAVGVDFSRAMVTEAKRRYSGVEFEEGDAENLPFPAHRFDAVVMNFGILHLGRPEKALAEANRVLRPKGRIGFTVWARPEEAVGFQIVLRAVETHGRSEVPLPPGPPFFRFSNAEECCRALLEAGFVTPQVEKVPQVWRLPSPDALFGAMLASTVRTAGLLRAQSVDALEAIRQAIGEAAKAYQKGDGIELPMPAILASARKP